MEYLKEKIMEEEEERKWLLCRLTSQKQKAIKDLNQSNNQRGKSTIQKLYQKKRILSKDIQTNQQNKTFKAITINMVLRQIDS